MSKRLLQTVNVVLALWILFRAGLTVLEGTDNPLYGTSSVPDIPALDSNLRFLGGIGVAMALLLLWITPRIAERTVAFRVVWICRLFGGVGRLVSVAVVGAPPIPMLVFTVSEVVFIPFLLYWQSTLSRKQDGGPRHRPAA